MRRTDDLKGEHRRPVANGMWQPLPWNTLQHRSVREKARKSAPRPGLQPESHLKTRALVSRIDKLNNATAPSRCWPVAGSTDGACYSGLGLAQIYFRQVDKSRLSILGADDQGVPPTQILHEVVLANAATRLLFGAKQTWAGCAGMSALQDISLQRLGNTSRKDWCLTDSNFSISTMTKCVCETPRFKLGSAVAAYLFENTRRRALPSRRF